MAHQVGLDGVFVPKSADAEIAIFVVRKSEVVLCLCLCVCMCMCMCVCMRREPVAEVGVFLKPALQAPSHLQVPYEYP